MDGREASKHAKPTSDPTLQLHKFGYMLNISNKAKRLIKQKSLSPSALPENLVSLELGKVTRTKRVINIAFRNHKYSSVGNKDSQSRGKKGELTNDGTQNSRNQLLFLHLSFTPRHARESWLIAIKNWNIFRKNNNVATHPGVFAGHNCCMFDVRWQLSQCSSSI